MNQKFILSGEKTAKKVTLFSDEKPKKFSRKRSDCDRSIDSKRSKENSIGSPYIKNVGQHSSHINQIQINPFSHIEKLNFSFVSDLDKQDKSRKMPYSRTNSSREKLKEGTAFNIRIEMLEVQNKAKEAECERLRLSLDEQRQKRRKSQNERKAIVKEIQQVQKFNQKLAIQNKKLLKEKQYFIKQVEFLEKINYDDKTRQLQSFRQKYMVEQLEKLRAELKHKRTSKEEELQRQCEQFMHERDRANESVRAMKSMVEVLRAKADRYQQQLIEDRQITREKILASQEYLELKERYRRFIQTYKEMRTQNWNLKKILEGKEADFVLSDSDTDTRS